MEAARERDATALFADAIAEAVVKRLEAAKTKKDPRLCGGIPHSLLRGRMKEADITSSYIARKWRASPSTISQRLGGKTPWTAWEMYDLMQMLNIPPEEMHDYFPDYRQKKGGKR